MGARVVWTGGTNSSDQGAAHGSDQGGAHGSDQVAMLAPQGPLQPHVEPDKATHRHYLTRAMVGWASLVLRESNPCDLQQRGWRP